MIHNKVVSQKSGGFTLLEVMIAVALIAIAIVSLMASQSQSISVAGISRFNIDASFLARKKLTELRIIDYDSLSSETGEFEEDASGFSFELEVRPLDGDEIGFENEIDSLKIINLKIFRTGVPDETYWVRTVVMKQIEPGSP